MEDKKPSNPFAFSSTANKNSDTEYEQGMTLRDYFAAKAMQAYVSQLSQDYIRDPKYTEHFGVAELSYQVADEMLKQREL